MTSNQIARTLLAEALSINEAELPGNIRIGSIDQWDSLAHARILLALEERIGKQLDAAEAATIESLDDIVTTLSKHLKN